MPNKTSDPTKLFYATDVLQIIHFAHCVYTLVAGDNYATQLYYIITKTIFLIIFAITSFGYFVLILLARSRRDKGKLY